jgi:hypothetical protein
MALLENKGHKYQVNINKRMMQAGERMFYFLLRNGQSHDLPELLCLQMPCLKKKYYL